MICKSCGYENEQGAKFCGRCGMEINSPDQIIRCQKCSYQNKPGTTFCSSCGTKLGQRRNTANVPFLYIGAAALVLILFAFVILPRLTDAKSETTLPSSAYVTAPVMPQADQNQSVPKPARLTAEQFVGNVSLYPQIYITSAMASSEQDTYEGITFYNAENVFDGDTTTSWQEGVSGYGEGECITVYFGNDEDVQYISFLMGSNSLPGYFKENGKPKSLFLEFSDGSSFSYDFPLTESRYNLKLNRPVSTSYISMTILSTYPGTAHEDTAITEISVYGP